MSRDPPLPPCSDPVINPGGRYMKASAEEGGEAAVSALCLSVCFPVSLYFLQGKSHAVLPRPSSKWPRINLHHPPPSPLCLGGGGHRKCATQSWFCDGSPSLLPLDSEVPLLFPPCCSFVVDSGYIRLPLCMGGKERRGGAKGFIFPLLRRWTFSCIGRQTRVTYFPSFSSLVAPPHRFFYFSPVFFDTSRSFSFLLETDKSRLDGLSRRVGGSDWGRNCGLRFYASAFQAGFQVIAGKSPVNLDLVFGSGLGGGGICRVTTK